MPDGRLVRDRRGMATVQTRYRYLVVQEDGVDFLRLAPQVPVRTEITTYPLERTNDALEDLRAGRFRGAAVVVVDEEATA